MKRSIRSVRRSCKSSFSNLILKTLKVELIALVVFAGAIALPAIAQTQPPQIAQTPTAARIVYVNPVLGTDASNAGSQGFPFRTITAALQQAQPGTLIQLAPGSYTQDTGEVFPLVIPQGVILRGDTSNRGQTVTIIGSGSFGSPTFARQNITLRPLNDSLIAGVTVTNPNDRGTAIWVESTNATIRNSTLSNSVREGIFVTGTAAPLIEGNVFTGNRGNGISFARASQGEARGNLFQNTGFGIAISDTASPRITSNQVVQNTDGIVVSSTARPILRSNVIESNSRDGVVAITDALPDLGTTENPGQNVIRNNTRYDVYNATRTNTIAAVGNQIDASRISGRVDFVAANVGGSSSFSDVQGNWAQPYIEALAAQGIIGGFPDGTYRPNDPVTRAQFAAIINKAFTPNPKRSGVNFVDVSSNFWGYQAIQSAYQGGFLSGYPGQIFQPDQRIPRLQVLVSLASGLQLNSSNLTPLARFQDVSQIPNWATGSIAAATLRNIVVNYPNVNQLNPNRDATRAEVAAFIYQALVSAGQAQPIPSPYVVNP